VDTKRDVRKITFGEVEQYYSFPTCGSGVGHRQGGLRLNCADGRSEYARRRIVYEPSHPTCASVFSVQSITAAGESVALETRCESY
jgi:hypothetical protein